jgi:ATP-dependent DNA helicase RecQ
VEAKDDLLAVIETVTALKERFKTDHVIDVMVGRATSDVKSYGHEELEVFGCTQGEDKRHLNAVIRQAVLAGYINKDIENYGILHLTDKGKQFYKKPTSFKVVEDNDFQEEEEEPQMKGGAAGAADPELFAILTSLRKKIASHLQLPPYVIFQEPSLEAMATTYPITEEELQNIPGVGAGKAKRYGDEFLKVIKAYVEEKEIIRPEDMRVRSVANKSKLKISIIQAIDRKIDLRELASSIGLGFDQLLDEIEVIVNAGTRINISYFINDIMEDDDQNEIFDFFRENDNGSLDEAYREFCPDYSEEEIRLVRIKFLSELGN